MRILLIVLALLAGTGPALADQEASNVAHVTAGPYGRCYAKSIPKHVHDPEKGPRQQGTTRLFRVTDGADELVRSYDWFSQTIFLRCGFADDTVVVRIGPWHRGHDPHDDHLALAFYKGGMLLRRYSTLQLAGGTQSDGNGFSPNRNVSASVSHYTVFETPPKMERVVTAEGAVYSEDWVITATTIDGRKLVFDIETGALR